MSSTNIQCLNNRHSCKAYIRLENNRRKYHHLLLKTSNRIGVDVMGFARMQLLRLSLAICISVGYAKPPSQIVNGQNATAGEFPHQVSLQVWNQHFCGGSILDATHILTAAHCVVDDYGRLSYQNVEVVTGVTDFLSRNANNVFPVSEIIWHQNYNPKDSWRNDIALLKLAKSIPFNALQKPIKLPTRDAPDGARVLASGWGAGVYLAEKSETLRHLQKLSMGVIGLQRCKQIMGPNIQSGQICAAGTAGTGVCVGDSGGPLTYNGAVVGIASFVIPCGKGYPDIFTRVYQYLPWINNALKI